MAQYSHSGTWMPKRTGKAKIKASATWAQTREMRQKIHQEDEESHFQTSPPSSTPSVLPYLPVIPII